MAIYKCKMCGGDLNIGSDAVVVECDYCGTTQTVPTADNEKKLNLFNRANRLRLNSEFDKAAGIYESIIAEFPEEAEAYWGLCLCNYGIEYVDDPATGNKVPTCHRASFEKLASDENFNMAMEYADVAAQKVYRDEAREIDRIMEEILSVSKNEKPYDVFICYKETDDKGERTIDSVLAQDVYDALTAKGLKVFFARISLEDKLGKMYEPYIFAALNSAKVMLAIGTKYEHFHAVWVKNEWSRFLKIMAKDKSKALIPCYKDMDAYDMPDEFKALQAQDMGKIGFMQDLVRGVEKIIKSEKPQTKVVKETATIVQSNANTEALLKRAFMALEDGEFAKADQFCEQALNIDPENAQAYLGKLMAELKVREISDLEKCSESFENNGNYQKIIRFADEQFKDRVSGYLETVKKRCYEAEMKRRYDFAVEKKKKTKNLGDFEEISRLFELLGDYKDSAELAEECKNIANDKDKAYLSARKLYDEEKWEEAAEQFEMLGDFSDSAKRLEDCRNRISEQEKHQKLEKVEKIIEIAIAVILGVVFLVISINFLFKDSIKYNKAEKAEKEGNYALAAVTYGKLGDYKDAREKSLELWDEVAVRKTVAGKYGDIVVVQADGTVKAAGKNNYGQSYVESWEDIIAVDRTGLGFQTVGLKSDGTVVITDFIDDPEDSVSGYEIPQNYVSDWKDIVAISCGYDYVVGIKIDGTVVAAGDCKYSHDKIGGWTDIVAVSSDIGHSVGLKADGTVVLSTDPYGDDRKWADARDWKNIVAIHADYNFTVGLKSDGTVISTDEDLNEKLSDWKKIKDISIVGDHIYGLKSDGTVITPYENEMVASWSDIVAISDIAAIRSDGSAVIDISSYSFTDEHEDALANVKIPTKKIKPNKKIIN